MLTSWQQHTNSHVCCRMYAFDVHCNSYFPLFILLYGMCKVYTVLLYYAWRHHTSLCTIPSHLTDHKLWYAVLQFLLSPVLLHRSILATVLSNVLYIVALSYYHYLNFLGYSALPFLERTEVRVLTRLHRHTKASLLELCHVNSSLYDKMVCRSFCGRLVALPFWLSLRYWPTSIPQDSLWECTFRNTCAIVVYSVAGSGPPACKCLDSMQCIFVDACRWL